MAGTEGNCLDYNPTASQYTAMLEAFNRGVTLQVTGAGCINVNPFNRFMGGLVPPGATYATELATPRRTGFIGIRGLLANTAISFCFTHCFFSTVHNVFAIEARQDGVAPSNRNGVTNTPVCNIPEHLQHAMRTYTQQECHDEPAVRFNANYDPRLGMDMVCPNAFELGTCVAPTEDGCHILRDRPGVLYTTASLFDYGSPMVGIPYTLTDGTPDEGAEPYISLTVTPWMSNGIFANVQFSSAVTSFSSEPDTLSNPSIILNSVTGDIGDSFGFYLNFSTADAAIFSLSTGVADNCYMMVPQYFRTVPGLSYTARVVAQIEFGLCTLTVNRGSNL